MAGSDGQCSLEKLWTLFRFQALSHRLVYAFDVLVFFFLIFFYFLLFSQTVVLNSLS